MPSYYGSLPDHVPRAKTSTNPHGSWTTARLNESKEKLPEPISGITEVDNAFRTVENEFGNAIHEGKSYSYNPIIFIDGELATLYSNETLDELGCANLATLTTVFRVESHPHRAATMTIDYVFTYCESRVPLITARIPMTAVGSDFDIKQLTAKEVRHFFADMGLSHRQRHEAYRVQCKPDTEGIELFHDRQSQADMTRAGFPDLNNILSYITNQYEALVIDLDMFVSAKWKDFPFWASTLPDMLNLAHGEPLASIRAGLLSSRVVGPRTLNVLLPQNTVQLPALSRFESIDEQLTIVSDRFVRDAQYQTLTAEMFGNQLVHVIMISMEGMKVNVPNPADTPGCTTVPRNYLYHVVVARAKDMKRLIETCPPPGTLVSFQIDVPSAAVKQTMQERTDNERSAILGRQIFRSLADAEGEDIGSYKPPKRGTQEFEDAKDTPMKTETSCKHSTTWPNAPMGCIFCKAALEAADPKWFPSWLA